VRQSRSDLSYKRVMFARFEALLFTTPFRIKYPHCLRLYETLCDSLRNRRFLVSRVCHSTFGFLGELLDVASEAEG
jgi:hypothetical protein